MAAGTGADRPGYDMPGLARVLEAASPEVIEGLDFAVVAVDAGGLVRRCNRAALALFAAEDAIGRKFFEEVAPALAHAAVRSQIERALKRGALDLELGHAVAVADPLHGLRARMQPAAGGGFWLFLQRVD